jgi:hypothetical protein
VVIAPFVGTIGYDVVISFSCSWKDAMRIIAPSVAPEWNCLVSFTTVACATNSKGIDTMYCPTE